MAEQQVARPFSSAGTKGLVFAQEPELTGTCAVLHGESKFAEELIPFSRGDTMKTLRFGLALFAAAAIGLPSQLDAQSGSVEIGFDTGLTYTMYSDTDFTDSDNQTSINVPQQSIRLGFFVSDQLSIEPVVGFSYTDNFLGESLTQLAVAGRVLYHFSADPTRPRFYLGGGAGFNLIDFFDQQETQFGVGGGLGVKLPIADQMAIRIEGSFSRYFETDALLANSVIGAVVGFSFFTG
jgi:opacity protein-like surface antigen